MRSSPSGPTWPGAPHRAVVLCGPGNNGGDGFVVARLLWDRGWEVRVALFGDPARLQSDAGINQTRWRDRGPIRVFGPEDDDLQDQVTWLEDALYGLNDQEHQLHDNQHVVVIDALFGIGLSRPITSPGFVLQHLDARDPDEFPLAVHIVAVDLPSGLLRGQRSSADGEWPGAGSAPGCPVPT